MKKYCLYSKYSTHCKKLKDILQKNTKDFHYICIDNEKVRERIMKNEKIKIAYVPCILLIQDNGIIEKYEGEHAFQWVNSAISIEHFTNNKPQSIPQPQPIPRQVPQPQRVETKTSVNTLKNEQVNNQTFGERVEQIPPNTGQIPGKTREINKDASTNKAVINKKALNVKDLAAQMQEERESYDNKQQRPPNYPKDKP